MKEYLPQVASTAGGVLAGGLTVSWFLKNYIIKIDRMMVALAALEATIKSHMKTDERLYNERRELEKRMTIVEAQATAAHRRMDSRASNH